MARPPKLTPKVEDIICEKLALGMTYAGACGAARISFQAFNAWRKIGRALQEELSQNPERQLTDDEARFFSFITKVDAAEAQIEEDYTTMIYNEAARDVNNAWKWLNARRSSDYIPRQSIEHTGAGGGPVKLVVEYVNRRASSTNNPADTA